MILAHDLEHRGAHDAREIADPAEAERECRHDQMQELIAESPRSPAPITGSQPSFDGEEEDGVDRDDEGRNRDRADRDDAGQLVDAGVAPDRRDSSRAECRDDGPAEPGGDQHQRVGQVSAHHDGDRTLGSTCRCRGCPGGHARETRQAARAPAGRGPFLGDGARAFPALARGPSMMVAGSPGMTCGLISAMMRCRSAWQGRCAGEHRRACPSQCASRSQSSRSRAPAATGSECSGPMANGILHRPARRNSRLRF